MCMIADEVGTQVVEVVEMQPTKSSRTGRWIALAAGAIVVVVVIVVLVMVAGGGGGATGGGGGGY